MSKGWSQQFWGDYGALRRTLRSFSYGFLTAEDAAKLLGGSASTQKQRLKQIRSTLPEERQFDEDELQQLDAPGRKKRRQRLHLKGDAYAGGGNFLAETYFWSTLQEYEIFYGIQLLRILPEKRDLPKGRPLPKKRNRDDSLTATQIAHSLADVLSARFEASAQADDAAGDLFHPNTIFQHLERLKQHGYVVEQRQHGERRFSRARDVLWDPAKTPDAARKGETLRFAVDFLKNILPLAAPGFLLSATLAARYGSLRTTGTQPDAWQRLLRTPRPFLFLGRDLRRILDDDVAYQLLLARERGQEVRFRYERPDWEALAGAQTATREHPLVLRGATHAKPPRHGKVTPYRRAQPQAIIVDDLTGGRQQLVDADGNAYRLEGVYDVQVVPSPPADGTTTDAQDAEPAKNATNTKNEGGRKTPQKQLQAKASAPQGRIAFRLHARDAAHAQALARSVRHHLLDVRVKTLSDTLLACTMTCPADLRRQLPLLRTYLPYLEIVGKDAASVALRRRMRESIEEALANYAAETPGR